MTDSAEIARLKAEAAQAAAEAAAAKAQAAQAALDAALATQAGQSDQSETASQAAAPEAATQQAAPTETPAAPVESEPTAPAEASASEGELQGYAEQVRAGYSFTAPSMRLGAFLDGDTPVPGAPVGIPLGLMNRHCLVAGATGTGKTRTLQLMAERLSEAGVPVFVTDIKGDLTGLAQAGSSSEKLLARCASIGQNWEGKAFPTELLTLGGRGEGVPIRTTITEFGPLLLSRVLGLNDTQSSALQLIFHWADGQNLALIDLKDLRAVIDYLTNNDEGKEELKGGNDAATIRGHAHKIGNIKGGFTEENVAARGLQSGQFTQNHARGRRGDAADSLEFFLALVVICQVVDDGAQVFQVNERKVLTIGPVEDQLQC